MDEHNQGIFSIITAIYSFSKKGQGTTFLPQPPNCDPDTSPDIRMHPKKIALHIETSITQ